MVSVAYLGSQVLDNAPELLEGLKKRAGLTWDEISRRAGISTRTILKWRASDGEPDLSDFGRIAKACGIESVHALAEFVEGPKPRTERDEDLFRRAVQKAAEELTTLHARAVSAEAERDQLRDEIGRLHG